jgi:hypothetical protein
MLFLAEGRVQRPLQEAEHAVAAAWLGPMVDAGFLQSGYLDTAGGRVVMVLSAADRTEIDQRIGDLPVVRNGEVSFTITPVTALRFT